MTTRNMNSPIIQESELEVTIESTPIETILFCLFFHFKQKTINTDTREKPLDECNSETNSNQPQIIRNETSIQENTSKTQ